jgi:signal transduction histidine kinase
LEAALSQYLEKEAADGEFLFSLTNGLTEDLDARTAALAYRIAQEALVNVRKHAQASNVSLSIRPENRGVRVRIEDDGVGFDVEHSTARPGHLGLSAMQERAVLTGGWCRLTSVPGAGTIVDFWLPGEPGDRHRADAGRPAEES